MESQTFSELPRDNGLIYVEDLIRGKTSTAPIETGATHNFISREKVERLGLVVAKRN